LDLPVLHAHQHPWHHDLCHVLNGQRASRSSARARQTSARMASAKASQFPVNTAGSLPSSQKSVDGEAAFVKDVTLQEASEQPGPEDPPGQQCASCEKEISSAVAQTLCAQCSQPIHRASACRRTRNCMPYCLPCTAAQAQPSPQDRERVVRPLNSEGCNWSHTQANKLAGHLNEQHVPHWTEPIVQHLYINTVLNSCSTLRCCGCGRFYNNTQHGKNTHRGAPTNCSIMSENDSWARLQSDNYAALTAGLRMEPFGEAAMDGDVLVLSPPPGTGARRFRIVDCGHLAGDDHHCCLYKSCCGEADDTAPQSAQLKAKVAPMATAIARSRGLTDTCSGRGGSWARRSAILPLRSSRHRWL
jgi:hypothetical protein